MFNINQLSETSVVKVQPPNPLVNSSNGRELSTILNHLERLRTGDVDDSDGNKSGVPQWLRGKSSDKNAAAGYAGLPDGELVAVLACCYEMLRHAEMELAAIHARNAVR